MAAEGNQVEAQEMGGQKMLELPFRFFCFNYFLVLCFSVT